MWHEPVLRSLMTCENVRELAITYPHHAAIGVTADEKMGTTVGD